MFTNTGNKYAEKWTPEAVLERLAEIEQQARKDDTHYLGTALMHLRTSRRCWSYWRRKFLYDEEIIEQMDLIEGIFEAKLFEGALTSELNATTAIFGLKHNYGWGGQAKAEPQKEVSNKPLVHFKLSGGRSLVALRPDKADTTQS